MRLVRHANILHLSKIFLAASFSLCLHTIEINAKLDVYGFTKNDNTIISVANDDICTTQTCTELAETMKENIHHLRTPCEDFYYSACGNWDRQNPSPSYIEKTAWDEQFKTNMKIQEKFTDILNVLLPNENSTALHKANQFVMSCLYTSPIESHFMNPIVDLVRENGDWPLSKPTNSLNKKKFEIQETHEKYAKKAALSSLFTINSDYPNLYMGKPRLSIEIPQLHVEQRNFADLYRNVTWRRYYVKYISSVAESIANKTNSKVSITQIKIAADDVIALEAKLYGISGNKRSPSQRSISIKTLQTAWEISIGDQKDKLSIKWLDVIKGRLEGSDLTVNDDSIVIVSPANLIADLGKALREHSATTIVNYIHWKVIQNLQRYTSMSIRETKSVLEKDLFGPKYPKRRVPLSPWITDGLKHALHYLFVKKTHNSETKKIMRDMREKIRAAIEFDLRKENKDFDPRVTETLVNALNSIKVSVDYPAWQENSSELDKYYRKLTIGTNYFSNILAVRKFRETVAFDHLKERQDEKNPTFNIRPTGYLELSDETNSTMFPIGNLPPAEIDLELPMAVNYARAGSAIGREMVYLLFKNLEYLFHDYSTDQTFSWADSRMQAYKLRLKSFISQYQDIFPLYKAASRMDEHVSDNGGVKAAFRAYRMAKSDGTIAPKILKDFIPNLNDEHLFFYAYANMWCEYCMATDFIKKVIDETHSWGRSRLFLPLLNMKDFLELFHCASRTVFDKYV